MKLRAAFNCFTFVGHFKRGKMSTIELRAALFCFVQLTSFNSKLKKQFQD